MKSIQNLSKCATTSPSLCISPGILQYRCSMSDDDDEREDKSHQETSLSLCEYYNPNKKSSQDQLPCHFYIVIYYAIYHHSKTKRTALLLSQDHTVQSHLSEVHHVIRISHLQEFAFARPSRSHPSSIMLRILFPTPLPHIRLAKLPRP